MLLRSPILHSPHGFSDRQGGISTQSHTSTLNLAFGRGDEDAVVLENLKLFAEEVGVLPRSIVSAHQIHSDTIHKADITDCGKGYFSKEGYLEGDGYITNTPGVTVAVKTADCVPILFEGVREGKVIAVGAVHAGWRGTVAGIAPKCVKMLCKEYGLLPYEISAVIGPCIHACCYEVSEELLQSASEKLGSLARLYFRPAEASGKYFLDLPGLNRALLEAAGLLQDRIGLIDLCTCCHPEQFFSHRYSKGLRGTMLSVIGMVRS